MPFFQNILLIKNLVLKDLEAPANSVINFLSTKENLQWQQQGKDVIVSLPDYNPE